MVLCNAPGDAYAGAGESEVGKLLWEFMRTSMDCLQRIADAQQNTARATDSRVRPSSHYFCLCCVVSPSPLLG